MDTLLRQIPKVDDLLRLPALNTLAAEVGAAAVTEAVRRTLDRLRADILVGTVTELPSTEALCAQISASCRASRLPSLRGVINATGIVLHTNLGRACLSDRALAAARGVSQGYSTLEYDLTAGERGQRYAHVEPLLCRLTGAEAAMVANNNAAAVLLILLRPHRRRRSHYLPWRAGGDRRFLPDAGCDGRPGGAVLREVGSTNKTHLSDYANAISEQTRALLKVHTSNYRIVGFTESVSPAALAELGRSRSIPVIEDLGSGCLVDLAPLGLRDEPTVQASVKAGVDVLSFSGDKLLGGPQAGIIVGKRRCIDLLKRHPLARALRVDKLTLAALEALCKHMWTAPPFRRSRCSPCWPKHRRSCASGQSHSAPHGRERRDRRGGFHGKPGGGRGSPHPDAALLRRGCRPKGQRRRTGSAATAAACTIIVRIAHDRCLLDMRTLFPADLDEILQAFRETAS